MRITSVQTVGQHPSAQLQYQAFGCPGMIRVHFCWVSLPFSNLLNLRGVLQSAPAVSIQAQCWFRRVWLEVFGMHGFNHFIIASSLLYRSQYMTTTGRKLQLNSRISSSKSLLGLWNPSWNPIKTSKTQEDNSNPTRFILHVSKPVTS